MTSLKRNFAVAGIGLGMLVLGMLWSSVNTALASIQKDLSASVLQLQWMMNSFGICLCVPLLTMGKLGDGYGRKKVFLWGLIVALIAATIAGFASQIHVLIICMGLFGLGGSVILPLSQALLVHQFPESEKGKAVALWSVLASITLASGPVVSGVILTWLGWRWIFWIDVPIVLIAVAIVFFFVEKEKEFHKPHCDWLGVGLLAVIVGSLIMGIMQGPTWGWDSLRIIGLFILCFVTLCIFILVERKAEAPLFRPDLFSNRAFLFSAIPNGCTIGFIWVSFFTIPLFLQNMEALSPLETGLTLLLVTLPMTLLSVRVSKACHKWGAKPLMLAGYICFAIAFLLQSLFIPSFWSLGLGCLALGFGWALTWGPSISCALSSIPHNIAGIASGMFTTLQELGAILSLSIAGVFFRTAQQHHLNPNMDAIHSALTNSTPDQIDSLLSNPAAVASQLGANSQVVPWLREAFFAGYQASFWFLFGVCLIAILITSFLPKSESVAKQ